MTDVIRTADGRAESLRFWAKRLEKQFKTGQHFTRADLHRAIWPKHPVGAWIVIHSNELDLIADQMEDAGLIYPSFGVRGGEGYQLAEVA
jgi:hypothetical protein